MSNRIWSLDMTFVASDAEMVPPRTREDCPMTVEVPCPRCLVEAVTVVLEQDGLSLGTPTYAMSVELPCGSCGHELTREEIADVKDSAKRLVREGT